MFFAEVQRLESFGLYVDNAHLKFIKINAKEQFFGTGIKLGKLSWLPPNEIFL